MLKMVPRRGDAPRSAGYRPAALLLSYRGIKRNGGAPENAWRDSASLDARLIWPGLERGNRTLDALIGRSGFRDRFLVYAGRAPLNGAHTRIAAPAAVQLLAPHLMKVRCRARRSHLEPQPLEAAYAYSITPCGHETGSSGWIRTNTAALTERHPTVRSPRILKWWTRTVTLRLLPGANRSCDFHTASPLEIGGSCGLCSRDPPLDKRALY